MSCAFESVGNTALKARMNVDNIVQCCDASRQPHGWMAWFYSHCASAMLRCYDLNWHRILYIGVPMAWPK